MEFLDIFFIIILILGAVKGYMKGFIIELFSLVAFFIGLFAAMTFSLPVTEKFFSESSYSGIISIAVFIALFILLSIVINLTAKMIKKVVDLTFLGFFDNILGSLAAMFKWVLIVSIIFWILNTVGIVLPESFTESSVLLPYIAPIGPAAFSFAADIFPFLRDILESIENFGNSDRMALVRFQIKESIFVLC